MKKDDREIHELKCPVCGKLIISLNERQADVNMKMHMISHDKKKKE